MSPQVAGPYLPQFEIYWRKLDQGDTGKVAPMLAAQFLKLSGLSDQTLGKVGLSRDRSLQDSDSRDSHSRDSHSQDSHSQDSHIQYSHSQDSHCQDSHSQDSLDYPDCQM